MFAVGGFLFMVDVVEGVPFLMTGDMEELGGGAIDVTPAQVEGVEEGAGEEPGTKRSTSLSLRKRALKFMI